MNKNICQQLEPVLISGASRGIGKACAKAMAHQGITKLILTARSKEDLISTKEEIENQFPECKVFIRQCNHESSKDIQSLVFELKEKKLEPKGIVANVGDNPLHRQGPRKMSSTSIDTLIKTFTINVANAHALISPFLKQYQRDGGRIILIGSQAYQYGVRGQLAYNVSKSALIGYKNTLVSEYGSKNVFCHLINPGMVANQRTQRLRQKIGEIETVSEQDVALSICNALFQSHQNGMDINI